MNCSFSEGGNTGFISDSTQTALLISGFLITEHICFICPLPHRIQTRASAHQERRQAPLSRTLCARYGPGCWMKHQTAYRHPKPPPVPLHQTWTLFTQQPMFLDFYLVCFRGKLTYRWYCSSLKLDCKSNMRIIDSLSVTLQIQWV